MRLSEAVEKRLEEVRETQGPTVYKEERLKECVKAMKKISKNFDPVKAGWPVGRKRKVSGKKRTPRRKK